MGRYRPHPIARDRRAGIGDRDGPARAVGKSANRGSDRLGEV